jgi:hypothetical protein
MVEPYLDPDVILNGLKNGVLSVNQAYALFREKKNASLAFLPERIWEMLTDLQHTNSSELEAPLNRVLEVFWKLFGPGTCINILPGYGGPLVESFFREKLDHALNEFSDEELIRLGNQYWEKPLYQAVLDARNRRLIPIAEQLLRNPVELNQDVAEVRNRFSYYHFTPELNEVFDKVEMGLAAGGDEFDQAALLKHLRTLFEKLHEQVGQKLQSGKPETVDGTNLGSCGQALDFLSRKSVLTEKMRDLGKSLYGVLSNEGVHAFKTEREYVRLCRNMIAEYALVLFFELERRLLL